MPTKTVKTLSGEVVDSNICFLQGSESGLDVTNWNSLDYIDNSSNMYSNFSRSLILSFLISKIDILSKSSPTETSTRILFIKYNTMLSC